MLPRPPQPEQSPVTNARAVMVLPGEQLAAAPNISIQQALPNRLKYLDRTHLEALSVPVLEGLAKDRNYVLRQRTSFIPAAKGAVGGIYQFAIKLLWVES